MEKGPLGNEEINLTLVDKSASPFSVFVGFKNNPPSPEDLQEGAKIVNEFYDLGTTETDMPDCIETITIKRSAKNG